MKRYGKTIRNIVLILLTLILVSCNANDPKPSGGNHRQTLTFSITDNLSADTDGLKSATAGSNIVLSVDTALPDDLPGNSVRWYIDYVDKPLEIGYGKTFTFTPEAGTNFRYKIYAQINSDKYSGKSTNTETIYVATENRFIPYVKTIYKHIDLTDFKPGISVSVYGKNNGAAYVIFNLYDGLAQIKGNVRNTESMQHVLGSISKSFTAASIIKAFSESGDTVDTLIARLKETKVSEFCDGLNLSALVTSGQINPYASLHQVLTHTSGMGDFVDVPLVLDLLCYDKQSIASLASLISSDLDTPSYKFESWSPEKILPYIVPRNNVTFTDGGTYSTFYSTPCYDLLGMIAEYKTGENLNTYMAESFIGPLGLSKTVAGKNIKIILAPQDIQKDSEYKKVADPHVYATGLKALVTGHSTISESQFNLIQELILPKKELYDFRELSDNVNKVFCEASWCGGGMIGTSDLVAKWCYNILCKNDADVNTDIKLVHDVMRKSETLGLSYGYGLTDVNPGTGANKISFIGHYGITAGTVNLMAYNDDTDLAYVVFTDAIQVDDPVETGVGLNPTWLIHDLCAIDLNKEPIIH